MSDGNLLPVCEYNTEEQLDGVICFSLKCFLSIWNGEPTNFQVTQAFILRLNPKVMELALFQPYWPNFCFPLKSEPKLRSSQSGLCPSSRGAAR